MIRAIDVSSHQPVDLTDLIADYQPDLVIVKLYQRIESIPPAHSLAQIASAVEHGCEVAGYLWLYANVDPRQAVDEAIDVGARSDAVIPWLGLDVESYTDGSIPDGPTIAAAVAECEAAGLQPVIYWSEEMWRRAGQPADGIEHVPQWIADYNGIADLDGVPIFGPWTRAQVWGHQWTSDPIDQSVFDPVWRTPVSAFNPTLEDLQVLLAYLQGDVADAVERPFRALQRRLRGRLSVAELGEIEAALNTLRTAGR